MTQQSNRNNSRGNKSSSFGERIESSDQYTLDELHQMATEMNIEGRSSMNKDELIKAINDQSSSSGSGSSGGSGSGSGGNSSNR